MLRNKKAMTTMLSDATLARIKKLSAKATPGQWRDDGADVIATHNHLSRYVLDYNRTIAANVDKSEAEANAQLFALLRNNAEALISRLEAAEAERERMWCQACGTVTRNHECDCTQFGTNSGTQNLVNYADSLCSNIQNLQAELEAVEARAAAAEAERDVLRTILHDVSANRF